MSTKVRTSSEQASEICRHLFPVNDSKTYLMSLKQMLAKMKAHFDLLEEEELLKALVQVYFDCGPKYPAKRVLASFLQNTQDKTAIKIEKVLKDQLTDEIIACQQFSEFCSVRSLVEQINCLMENFKMGEACLQETRMLALNFLSEALSAFVKSSHHKMPPVARNEVMHHCLATIKTTNRLIQKCFPACPDAPSGDVNIHEIAVRFLHSGLQILKQDDFLTDCRCGVGMVFVLLLKLSSGFQYIHIILKSVFQYDPNSDDDQCFTLPQYLNTVNLSVLSSDDQSILSTLCLYFGLLPMIDTPDLVRPLTDGGWILTNMFLDRLLALTSRCVDTGSKVLLAKTITLWTNRTCCILENGECPPDLTSCLTGEGHVISGILQYVWTTWDDQLDVLRQNAKSTFENCIKIHQLAARSGDPHQDKFLRHSTQKLLDVTWSNKGKYGCLGSIVSHIGAAILLEWNPGIADDVLSQLEEQALACYASDLYEKLFKAHHKEMTDRLCASSDSNMTNAEPHQADMTNWMTKWVDPVIQALCGSNKKLKLHIIEYILPKLLKFSRECLNYMIKTLSKTGNTSHGQIGALVMCIRRARALGLLNTPQVSSAGIGEDGGLWYGLVSPDVLKYALTCADEQVRLDAFALLCENMKTSEPISELEMSLLRYFLPFNLNNQSPAFRQYLLAYLHKLLVRLRESGCLQIRLSSKKKHGTDRLMDQHILSSYKSFLVWLQSHLFEGLYPGSAFARRLTCLAGLVLITQVFPDDDVQDVHHFYSQMKFSHINSLLECLMDTFEENKIAAVKILTYCFKHGCGLQTQSQVESLFSSAMELSCSTKPHDCTTASYIFKVLLHQPIILQVMRSYVTDLKLLSSNEEKTNVLGGSFDAVIDSCTELMLLTILLISLNDQTAVARKSLIVAAANRPMYPTMHCIRYILSDVDWRQVSDKSLAQWKQFMNSLIDVCLEVSEVVSPVVQDSSPEGNVPTESIMGPGLNVDAVVQSDDEKQLMLDSVESEKTVTLMPEYLIVCCWRSIKEVSLILGQICLDVSVGDTGMVSYQKMLSIGKYFTTQLLESKHRGAFELAYAGFVKMCEMLWRSPSEDLHGLPSKWLDEVMSDIISDDHVSRLCATRRSAGVPFYVQALVTTEPVSTGRACFKSAMTKLLELALEQRAETQVHNAQVHSLNILRALFRDTRLGEEVVPYVADGLKAAILGFKSQVWAVRNSSTLLLSALMTRIFGVKRSKDESAMSKKNCQTGRAFFHRYPSLYQFLLSELTEATQDIECQEKLQLHPSLYPVLMLLGRLFPSSLEGADTHLSLSAFIPLVLKCSSSPVFKTRLMAARALQPLASKDQLASLLLQLVARLPREKNNQMRQSYIHGILLQIQHLLTLVPTMKSLMAVEIISSVLPAWRNVFWLTSRSNNCVATRKVALDISDCLVTFLEENNVSDTLCEELIAILEQELTDQTYYSSHTPTLTEYSTTIAHLCLKYLTRQLQSDADGIPSSKVDQERKAKETDHKNMLSQEQVVLLLLESEMYEVRLSVLKMLSRSFSHLTRRARQMDGEKEEECQWMTAAVVDRLGQSEGLYEKLLDMALVSEWYQECLTMVYGVLCVHPTAEVFSKKNGVCKTFEQILHNLKNGMRDDVKSAMLKFSSILLPTVYTTLSECSDESTKTCIHEWCQVLQECSGTEQSVQLQHSCASIFQHHAGILLLDPKQVLSDLVFDLWGVVFNLLQEDDLEVKETAAQILSSLDNSSRNDLQATLVLERLMTLLTDTQGQRDPVGCLRSLITWITETEEEEQNEGVRLFDKGEMNTYREDIMFVDLCQHQIMQLMSTCETRKVSVGLDQSVTNTVQSILISALETQSKRILSLKPVDEKILIETPIYYSVYESVYRTHSLLLCVKMLPNSDHLVKMLPNSDHLQTLCDTMYSAINDKFSEQLHNNRLARLTKS